MTKIVETVRIAEDPNKLWQEIGKFGAVGRWHPMLTKVDSEGDREGALRMAEGRDGSRHTERLLEMSPEHHLYRYRMELTALPVRDYVSELRVVDNGDRTSTVWWSAEFESTSPDATSTVQTVRGFLKAGLANLKALHA
jgi:mxaD protein